MNSFIKYTLATITGLFIFTIIAGIFSATAIVGMVASSAPTTTISDKSVLVVDLSGSIAEQGGNDIIGRLTGGSHADQGLDDMLWAIEKAADEPKIKGIYLEAGDLSASYATLQELRGALAKFKKRGKWVVAYADSYSQCAYYVASVADKIWINPQGMVDWHGLGAQTVFVKDFLAKFGVRYQVMKVGKFKSFTETYTESKMSDANREQVSAFVGGTWKNIVADVAKSRKVSADSLNAYADRLIGFEPTANLRRYRLVDALMYADKVKDNVRQLLGIGSDDDINQLSVDDMAYTDGDDADGDGDEIAVYYAYGSIVQSADDMAYSQDHMIAADDMCDDLAALADDDDVKAVVIRVNSGGGDAFASEQIWHQVVELKKKKPVVISMGDLAASGAYYLSCPASWIVAQPNTLTGSIGIFAAIPDASGLITEKLGVKFDEVKTNRNSTFGNTLARPFNDEETHYLQAYVNRGYELFRKRVADGRHQSTEAIENIAQGRVWLGQDALKLKLVDQLGCLDDAVAKAASLAKCKDYYTAEYPGQASIVDQIFGLMGSRNNLDSQLRSSLGALYEPFVMLRNLNGQSVVRAQMPFAVDIK